MSYELPDFPLGCVFRSETSKGTVDCTQFDNKELMLKHLNGMLDTLPNCEITIYKKTIEYDPELKRDREYCRYHNIPKTIG